ncbi:hypothetical protein [Mesorhizobium sp.]|uniref:hypothetical protein n=1 Tax=Mesorhizobium sp. TaxID=1871066 RepID=UPI000FE8C42A|nr:hypothetical protein [Mesorhizobium sp.]RWE03820.1 MAG: hypothetical protein EOS40_01505 [Mesorhizobium sp.]
MSRKFRSIALGAALIAAAALGACRDTGKEQLFAISGKLFEFNYRLGIATYVITLRPLRPMAEGQVAVVNFQNPAGGDPLIVNQKIWPKLPHITLTSPPLSCVVKDKPYSVTIRIEDSSGTLLQSLETTMTSTEDQTMLPDRPLVIGPKYELNPDLAGHPDGKLPDEPKPDCSKAV